MLFVLAVFLLLGGFGTGGSLPTGLFDATFWALGWAAWLAPLALVYFGTHKFKSDDRRVPLGKLSSMLALLITSAAWLHVAFASIDQLSGEMVGGNGGAVGRLLGGTVLGALDKMPASLLFFVFSVLAFFAAFGISPQVILKLGKIFQRPEREPIELESLKVRATDTGFKLNAGVPVERDEPLKEQPRLSNLKNTAQKLTPKENHDALTVPTDPNWKFPGIELLNQKQDKANAGDVEGNAEMIKETFTNFNINVEMEIGRAHV